jgi:hypothetical protein
MRAAYHRPSWGRPAGRWGRIVLMAGRDQRLTLPARCTLVRRPSCGPATASR